VNIQDLVIHPREMDLVAGTHGRGIWILDDITPLQQLTPEVRARDGHLFEQKPATIWENRSRGGQRGHFWFGGENPRTFQPAANLPRAPHRNFAIISYWLKEASEGRCGAGDLGPGGSRGSTEAVLDGGPGIGRYEWDLSFDAPAGVPVGGSDARRAGPGGGQGQRPQRSMAGPGSYRVTLTVEGHTWHTILVVRADPLLAGGS
jgi:hypothetical protein